MATVARPRSVRRRRGPARGATAAVAERALRDARTRTIAFAYLFAAVAFIQPVSYRHTYPTLPSRLAFAHSFADNKAVVLFYGRAYDLQSVGGYTAWRVGGILAIFAAVYGMLAAVRALRAEEDGGRAELVLAGVVGRRPAYLAALTAIGASALALWLAELAGLVLGGLAVGKSAYLALATASVVPVFAGVGALASQLAATRRSALELGGAALAVAFALRVIADTSAGLGWLRWTTPLGWAEALRPFSGARPAVILAPIAAGLLLLGISGWIAARRDVGRGLLTARDTAPPRLHLLSSAIAHALRGERVSLTVWLVGVGGFALIVGVISNSITATGLSAQLRHELAKFGSGAVTTPAGYVAFSFAFFVLVLSLFSVSQVATARHEETDERLETLLALPVTRARWLGGRLALAASAATVIALSAGLLAWVGAASQGVALPPARMLEAGANLLPVAILFLGIAGVAYALAPHAGTGVAYGLVAVAFLWQLFGSLLGAPRWIVDITPFAHVGFVPAQPLRAAAAATMAAIGAVGCLAAIALFKRRDLTGA